MRAKSNTKYKNRNRDYIEEYLKNHPCVDCGNPDIRVLEFDHVRGVKIDSVTNFVKKSAKLSRLIDEIAKCDIRCANCHRIITKERHKNKTNKTELLA